MIAFFLFYDYSISLYFSEDINYIFFEVSYALYINSIASVFFALCSVPFSQEG